MKVSDTTIFFLSAHSILFFIFFIVNLLLMRYERAWWYGIPEEGCGIICDSFYYTTATHTSIGFGDITPKNNFIKICTSVHMLIVFTLIILNFDVIQN